MEFSKKQLQRVKDKIRAAGTSYAKVAGDLKISEYLLRDLLNGRNHATRGEGHRAAVMLGLKKETALEFLPAPAPISRETAASAEMSEATARQNGA